MARIYIDTDKWVTPTKYAEIVGITQSAVTKRMDKKQVETLVIPEIGVKLVKRPNEKQE